MTGLPSPRCPRHTTTMPAPKLPDAIYLNDRLVPPAEATVSVYDHGLLYGDGVFEGIRVYGGRVFLMSQHIDRLYESARAIRLDVEKSPEEMAAATRETVKANNITDGYIRLIITRGGNQLGLNPFMTTDSQTIIIADSIKLYPDEYYRDGLKLITASTIRNHPAALSPRIKSLNYLNNVLAKIEAIDAGCLEAVMLNHKGEVAECTGDNLFLVKNGRILTPPLDAGILAGITRDTVIMLARKAGLDVRETALTRHDIYTADECFLTGTAAEVIAATSLDKREIGTGKPGPITQQLLAAFREFTTTFDDD